MRGFYTVQGGGKDICVNYPLLHLNGEVHPFQTPCHGGGLPYALSCGSPIVILGEVKVSAQVPKVVFGGYCEAVAIPYVSGEAASSSSIGCKGKTLVISNLCPNVLEVASAHFLSA